MNLKKQTITTLAEMICGAAGGTGFVWENFPYRTGTGLTEFFEACELDFAHDGSTRRYWVIDRLNELNELPAPQPQLPSPQITRVILELLDYAELKQSGINPDDAMADVNLALGRDGLRVLYDEAKNCYIQRTGTQITSTRSPLETRWARNEMERRNELCRHLGKMSEDQIIEEFLQPLFMQLGFSRIFDQWPH